MNRRFDGQVQYGVLVNHDGNDDVGFSESSKEVRRNRVDAAIKKLLSSPDSNNVNLLRYLSEIYSYLTLYIDYGVDQVLTQKLDSDFIPINPNFGTLNQTIPEVGSNVYTYFKNIVNASIDPD